ncbi:Guanine nucleotide exchange factor subunit Rich [Portunus trituberculatus]|uniref:Guanine nucleotide exchange factor subunit Rich n=1 Tax=Portunus trituberculatus TaxID=210409 RepID=A0A5B7I8M8_PORTR|nr:Guanine nucleotide exchange factor subunit Rich [Portunus trituberculatus]
MFTTLIITQHAGGSPGSVVVSRVQEVDISGLTVHPACVVSVLLTSLRTESWQANSGQHSLLPAQSVIINISGKVLMIQRDQQQPLGSPNNGKLVRKQ